MDKSLFADKQRFRENTMHGTPQFPLQVYVNNFDWYVNRIIDWHWHPELEFMVMLSGDVQFYLNDKCFEIHDGEGMFVNSGTMHMERPLREGTSPIMHTVCFLSEFIGDCGENLIYTKYIRPVTDRESLSGMKLSPDIPWQAEILARLRRLYGLLRDTPFGYELEMRNLISEIWLRLAVNVCSEDSGSKSKRTLLSEKRLKQMMSFIHENYRRDLSIEEIARSANISKSECFRCFSRIIDKKPIAYLNEYRLKNAAVLLSTTDMQITEVCLNCGFSHISYFGKLFRRFYGMTPKEFRLASDRNRK